MSLLNRLFSKAVTDARKWMSSSTRVISGDSQRPSFSNGEAIKHYSSWIYAAANLNAYAVASQPLRLYVRNRSAGTKLWNTRRTDRRAKSYLSGSLEQLPSRYAMTKAAEYGDDYEVVTDNHPVLDLLSKANPWQNGFEQTVLRVLYLELTGNAYLHPVLDRRLGIPVELWTMPSQWVEIVPGKEEFVDGYLYGVSYEKRAFFERDEVIHFKRPNPRDIYYGMGKVEAAWMAATNNQSLHDMDYHWFANKARPDWLLTVKGDASSEEIDRLEAQIDSKLRGTRRTGRFLTATADIDIKPLSFSPKDMMGREQIVEEIAAVFGVPVTMVKANDPNLASATVGFTSWKATSVLPLMRMDEEVLNQTLLPLFGIEDDAFLAYDNPVAADEKFETEKRRAYAAGGILTVNEVREMEGLEAVSDPAASRLLINGQPLGGQPPQPAASPFAGLFGASAQPRQDAALTFGTATDTKTEPLAPKVVEATETKAVERKDALGDCVSEKIPKLLDEGYEQDQAVAIAYSMCSEGKSLDQVIADRRAAKKSCGCRCVSTEAAKVEIKDCGTGEGGFKPGNSCGDEEGGSSSTQARSDLKRSLSQVATGYYISQEQMQSIEKSIDDGLFDGISFEDVNDLQSMQANRTQFIEKATKAISDSGHPFAADIISETYIRSNPSLGIERMNSSFDSPMQKIEFLADVSSAASISSAMFADPLQSVSIASGGKSTQDALDRVGALGKFENGEISVDATTLAQDSVGRAKTIVHEMSHANHKSLAVRSLSPMDMAIATRDGMREYGLTSSHEFVAVFNEMLASGSKFGAASWKLYEKFEGPVHKAEFQKDRTK